MDDGGWRMEDGGRPGKSRALYNHLPVCITHGTTKAFFTSSSDLRLPRRALHLHHHHHHRLRLHFLDGLPASKALLFKNSQSSISDQQISPEQIWPAFFQIGLSHLPVRRPALGGASISPVSSQRVILRLFTI